MTCGDTISFMETGTRPTAAVNAGKSGWCHWHVGSSETAVLIQYGERASGPPVALYACAPCREQRGLTPMRAAS